MRALSARAPLLHLSVRQLARTEHATALEAGLADLAAGFIAAPRPSLRTRKLFGDRFVCMTREGHPAAEAGLTLEGCLALFHVALFHVAVSRHGPERMVANAPAALGWPWGRPSAWC